MSRKGILNSTTSSNTAITTTFPEGHNRSASSHSTETFGAFDQMELNRESRNSRGPLRIDPTPYCFGQQPPSYPSRASQKSVRHSDDVEYFGGDSTRNHKVYLPTTLPPSEASTSATSHRAYDKLSEVYSHSGDTVEFARNFGLFLDDCVPVYVWIVLLVCLALWGFGMIMVGAFNIPFCPAQPLIPIYMLVMGSLFIVFATFKIYLLWPLPVGSKRSLAADVAKKGCEIILLLVIIVWLILGCDWIYSIRGRVHHDDSMFEQNHCEWSLYWAAWMSVTMHLIFIALLLLLVMAMLIHALCKSKD